MHFAADIRIISQHNALGSNTVGAINTAIIGILNEARCFSLRSVSYNGSSVSPLEDVQLCQFVNVCRTDKLYLFFFPSSVSFISSKHVGDIAHPDDEHNNFIRYSISAEKPYELIDRS